VTYPGSKPGFFHYDQRGNVDFVGRRSTNIAGRFQQLRQLSDIRRYPPCLIAREQLAGRAPAGRDLEIDVSQRLTVTVANDETTAVVLFDISGRWEAVRRKVIPGRWTERLGNELRPSATRR
jgi:hypothetical protein